MEENIDFWRKDYIKRFRLDKEGKEILNFLVSVDKVLATQFMLNKYQTETYREDIIDSYFEKYDNEKINELLKDLEYAPLTPAEIKESNIKVIKKEKPKCALIGQDGNIFNLIGIASRTLKQNKLQEEAKEMVERVTNSNNYSEALNIIGEYVEITDEVGLEEDEELEED